jgi:DNA polymerase delta subunit 2
MLDVENGKLCYIIGTVYMDMPLKPNVLEDLAREVSQSAYGHGTLALAADT